MAKSRIKAVPTVGSLRELDCIDGVMMSFHRMGAGVPGAVPPLGGVVEPPDRRDSRYLIGM